MWASAEERASNTARSLSFGWSGSLSVGDSCRISQPAAIPRKIFKMVTWICVHCPPGGCGVNCYFKE